MFGLGRRGTGRIILDVATMERWPARLVRHQGLDAVMRDLVRQVEAKRAIVEQARERLGDPELLDRVPERAQPIYDEHLPRLRRMTQELLDTTLVLDDAFLIDAQEEAFRTVLKAFRDGTRKSVTALKEFLGPELLALDEAVAAMEDAMLAAYPALEKASFQNIKEVKLLIDDYRATRKKVVKLERLRDELRAELERLERKRRKHKEKISFFMGRARNSKYKGLLAEEEQLLGQMDKVKVKSLPAEEEERELAPIKQRLTWIRKQMIDDITAMNINEQRTFLESVKDDLKLRRRQLERVEERLEELSFDSYRPRLVEALAPFNARIEEADMIIEPEEEDVAPQ